MDIAREIFKDIEEAIQECITEKPVPISKSEFIKRLRDIKKKWTQ